MHGRFFVSIVLVLLPASVAAERIEYGGRSEAFWTDNVFGTREDVVDGVSARIAPWADVADDEGRVTWGIRYAPTYEYYADQSSLRGFDHDVGGRFAWQLGDRTALQLSERFQRYHGVTSFNDQAAPGEDIIAVGERQRFEVNHVSGTLEHQLGPLDLVSLSVSQSLYEFSEEDQPNHDFLGTDLLYSHRLSERTSIGSRFSWGRQTVDSRDVSDDVTDYYNLSGVLTHEFSPTFQVGLSAGPALIRGNSDEFEPSAQSTVAQFPLRQESDGSHFLDADTCSEVSPGIRVVGRKCKSIAPALTANQLADLDSSTAGNLLIVPFAGAVPGVDDTSTTYFADVTLSKQWERLGGELSYTRIAGSSTTIASVSDVVSGRLSWQVARRWTADLTGGFERREQASENFVLTQEVANQPSPLPAFPPGAQAVAVRAVLVDSAAEVDVLTLNLRVVCQLARRASLYASVAWREESQTGNVGFVGDSNRVYLSVGLNYSFEAIQF